MQITRACHQGWVNGRTRDSHYVEPFSAVTCNRCHSGRCFLHLLRIWNLHSVQALLSHNSDASHTAYHQLHQETAKTYAAGMPSVSQAIATGNIAERSLLLAYNASTFTACRPANSELTRLGFYDEPNKVCSVDTSLYHEDVTYSTNS